MAHEWSELPEEIIDLVVKRLPPYLNEFVQFSCVCKSWNNVVNKLKSQKSTIFPCAPWLMLAKSKNDKQSKKAVVRTLYCHSTKRVFNYYLPQAKGTRCWGTPYGWLVTLGLDLNINLLHPLSRLQISLPSLPTFQHQFRGPTKVRPEQLCKSFVNKFALASDPSSPESGQCPLIMAIYGEICFLAVASPGDEAWTTVKCHESNYQDIIFFKGYFYAISCLGTLRVCEVSTPQPKTTDFASPPDNVNVCNLFYLVELSGDLCMVERRSKNIDDRTLGYHTVTRYFVVYKIDFHSKMWTEVEDLGDHALFLGNNTSFAISTSDYPGFKRNCIYFTDDHYCHYEVNFCDMGIYDMENETIEPFYFDNHQLSKFSRPVLFMPTL